MCNNSKCRSLHRCALKFYPSLHPPHPTEQISFYKIVKITRKERMLGTTIFPNVIMFLDHPPSPSHIEYIYNVCVHALFDRCVYGASSLKCKRTQWKLREPMQCQLNGLRGLPLNPAYTQIEEKVTGGRMRKMITNFVSPKF